jgi:hypothetical protein
LQNAPGPTYFPDSTVAPVNQNQQSGEQQALQYASNGATQVGNAATAGVTNLIERSGDVNNDPNFQGAVNAVIRPVVQQFMDAGGPLSQIRNEAVASGQYGGSRQGVAEGIATSRLNQQLLDTTAKMGTAAYQAGLESQARGVALAPTAQQAGVTPAALTASVGDVQRQQEQEMINAAIDRWNYNELLPYNKLAQYQSYIAGGFGSSSTTTQPTAKANPMMSALGGAASGAAIGSVVPGLGTAAGAVIGGLIGLMGSHM